MTRAALRALPLAVALSAGMARAGGVSLSVESGAIVLGRTESATLVLRLEEPPGSEDLPLRLAVNVGSFSEPKRLGSGKYRVVYVPPTTRFPQMALVALWRETGPDAPIEFLKLPLFGTTRLRVAAKPGTRALVDLGIDTFGPVAADARGEALVPIVVAPGVVEAAVTIEEQGGALSRKKLPIEVPPYNRLTVALVPHAIVADGRSVARIDVHYALGGARLPADRIHVEASAGRATFERAGGGTYVYRYVSPVSGDAREITFRVWVDGDPTAHASAKLSLGLPPPAMVVVRPPAAALTAGSGESAPVSALVLDTEGLGLPDQRVEIRANGEALAAPVYRGGGRYETPFTAPALYPPGGLVRLEATVVAPGKAALSGAANVQLLATSAPHAAGLRLAPSPVPTDGHTEATLRLDVRDVAGMPAQASQLVIAASDGTVGMLEARGKGVYVARYVPPAELPAGDATLRVVDTSGTFERRLPLPLRIPPGRLLLGVRGGYVSSLGDLAGPRFGADVAVPFRVGGASFALSATASYATASQRVADPASGLSGRSTATFVPIALRAGAELWAGRRAAVVIGGGAVLAVARFRDALGSTRTQASGVGGVGSASVSIAAGPGQLFADLTYAHVQVETPSASLPAGGAGVEVGYRVRLL